MYQDTRTRARNHTLKLVSGWEYLRKTDLTRAIYSPTTSYVGRNWDTQEVTSVRGPRPRGRLISTNPCTMKKISTHESLLSPQSINGPLGIINGPLISHNATYFKRWVMEGNGFAYAVYNDTPFWTLTTQPFSWDDRNYALQKAYAKANESIATVMVTLAELRETIAMLRSPLQGLRLFLGNLKRRTKRQSAGNVDKALQETWLEYRYGIMPLVLDTQNLIDAFEAKASNLYAFRGTVKRKKPVSQLFKRLIVGSAYFDMAYTTTDFQKTSVGLYVPPINLDRWGVGWTQILPTIVEIIPWSFVWNWFVDVDTWINGLMSSIHVRPTCGFVTEKHTRRIIAHVDEIVWSYTLGRSQCSLTLTRDAQHMQRTTDIGVDWKTIHLNNAFTTSWRRMVDSVALLWKKPTETIKFLKTFKGK